MVKHFTDAAVNVIHMVVVGGGGLVRGESRSRTPY